MQFSRLINPVDKMQIWSASGDGFSFAISYESRSGPGLHGASGFMPLMRIPPAAAALRNPGVFLRM